MINEKKQKECCQIMNQKIDNMVPIDIQTMQIVIQCETEKSNGTRNTAIIYNTKNGIF